MVVKNSWIPPVEVNKKPVETVYELKEEHKIPTFEEFMKTYERDEKVENSYRGEFTDWDKVPSYGPGSKQSSYSDDSDGARVARYAGNAGMGAASGMVTKFVGPVPSLITGAVATTVGEIGHALSSGDEAKDTWKYTSSLGTDMLIGAAGGTITEHLISGVVGSSGCDLAKEGWEIWREKGGKEKFNMNYHEFHKARGENYSRFCDVCKS